MLIENKLLLLLTRHDVMIAMKNKNLNNYFCIIRHSEMLDYSFSEFSMIYSLYFFFSLFIWRMIKIRFTNLRIFWEK